MWLNSEKIKYVETNFTNGLIRWSFYYILLFCVWIWCIDILKHFKANFLVVCLFHFIFGVYIHALKRSPLHFMLMLLNIFGHLFQTSSPTGHFMVGDCDHHFLWSTSAACPLKPKSDDDNTNTNVTCKVTNPSTGEKYWFFAILLTRIQCSRKS